MSEESKAADRRQYVSVRTAATAEVVIKRSRFIGFVAPVENAAQAEAMIADLQEQHKDAAHVCYAYRIGLHSPVTKLSDDGEPKGTAGRPILEVLERREVDNVCLAVVRYFGGTLLGAAGLTRAYAQTAAAALDEATIVQYWEHVLLTIRLSYADWSKAEHVVVDMGAETLTVDYLQDVTAQIAVPVTKEKALTHALTDVTGGQAVIRRGGTEYRPVAQRR